MLAYPAIDIRGGRCVRLSQGRDDARTDYYEDPVEPAVVFAQAGAAWIHVVDPDGAFGGAPLNLPTPRRIAALGPKIQFGGGMLDRPTAEAAYAACPSLVATGTAAGPAPSSPPLIRHANAPPPSGRPVWFLKALSGQPRARGAGLGLGLLQHRGGRAVGVGCGRFGWSVLEWNESAIGFYEKMGATVMPDWRICRVTGEALAGFGRQ